MESGQCPEDSPHVAIVCVAVEVGKCLGAASGLDLALEGAFAYVLLHEYEDYVVGGGLVWILACAPDVVIVGRFEDRVVAAR